MLAEIRMLGRVLSSDKMDGRDPRFILVKQNVMKRISQALETFNKNDLKQAANILTSIFIKQYA